MVKPSNYFRILAIALLLFLPGIVLGQIPQTMSYQGFLVDAEGNPISDGNVMLTFKIYDTDTNGEALYQEIHNEVNVTGGIFNVIIGSTNPLNLPFDKPYWLGITVGEDSELAPRIQLTSSPYSLNANSVADNAVSTEKIQNDAVTSEKISDGTIENNDLADNSITTEKIAENQVVKSLNGSTNNVTLEAGNNITISQSGDTLTIAATGGGVGGVIHSLDAADGDPTDVVFVDENGNVGIGTTEPQAKLQVDGDAQIDDKLEIKNGDGATVFKLDPEGKSFEFMDSDGSVFYRIAIEEVDTASPSLLKSSVNGEPNVETKQVGNKIITTNRNADGQIISERIFDSGGPTGTSINMFTRFNPESGNKLFESVNNGNTRTTTRFFPDGTTPRVINNTNDTPEGHITTRIEFREDGTKSFQQTQELTSTGITLKVEHFDSDGNLLTKFEQDENGNYTYFNRMGLEITKEEFNDLYEKKLTNPTTGATNTITAEGTTLIDGSGNTTTTSANGFTTTGNFTGTNFTGTNFIGAKFSRPDGTELGEGTANKLTDSEGNTVVSVDSEGNTIVNGEIFAKSFHLVNENGDTLWSVEKDGTSLHKGKETFEDGVKVQKGIETGNGTLNKNTQISGVNVPRGRVGEFFNFFPDNDDAAIVVSTDGLGESGVFVINNTINTDPAIRALTNGSGQAFIGFNTGTGRAGEFSNTNANNTEPALVAFHSGSGAAIVGVASGTGKAGQFFGDVDVTGTLTHGSISAKIDHPVDPANRYLNYAYVGSPDMKTVYDGVVTLNSQGETWVELPDWLEALNADFRYQLTAIGAPGPNLYIAEKISDNRFKIAGGTTGMEVSWQITGIRKDPFAQQHRIPVEQFKTDEEIGKYLHPRVYGMPETEGINPGTPIENK